MVGRKQGEIKNSIGNVEAKELKCTTHEHEVRWENVGGRGCAGWKGIKGGKWTNCDSIINKIYLKRTSCYISIKKYSFNKKKFYKDFLDMLTQEICFSPPKKTSVVCKPFQASIEF